MDSVVCNDRAIPQANRGLNITLILLTTARHHSLVFLELREMCLVSVKPICLLQMEELDSPMQNSSHSCIFKATFVLTNNDDGIDSYESSHEELRQVLQSCLLIREAYTEVVSPCKGIQELRSAIHSNNIQIQDIQFIGRRLNERKKNGFIRQIGGPREDAGCEQSYLPELTRATILADLRHKSQQDEKLSTYLIVSTFAKGLQSSLKNAAIAFSNKAFDCSTATGMSDNATTALDFERCVLACSLALVRPFDLVLDPFSGSCALPRVASELFAAVALSSDIVQCTKPTSTDQLSSVGCISDALNSSWKSQSFDALVCDPPYGIRTGHFSLLHGSSLSCSPDSAQSNPVAASANHVTVRDLVGVANKLLKESGRMAFWWFVARTHKHDQSLVEEINSAIASCGGAIELVGIGYDDCGLGTSQPVSSASSSSSSSSSMPTDVGSWLRCLVILGKRSSTSMMTRQSITHCCNVVKRTARSANLKEKNNLSSINNNPILMSLFEQHQKEFFRSCWTGTLPTMQHILRSIRSTIADPRSPSSALYSPDEIVTLFCSELRDEKGNTPLLVAAGFNRSECIQHLLVCGADVSITGSQSCNPIMRACKFGHYDTAKLLLNHCLQVGGDELVRRLSLEATNEQGFSAIAFAIAFDHVELLPLFSTEMLLSMNSAQLGICWHVVARWNCLKSFDYFMELYSQQQSTALALSLRSCCTNKSTPLHLAAKFGHVTMMRRLLEAGCIESLQDGNGRIAADVLLLWHGKRL